VGTVSLNGYQLALTSFGSYSLNTDGSTLNFNNGSLTWNVQGGNGFSPFTYSVDEIAFPVGGTINSGTVNLNQPYTFTWTGVSGADSVRFWLGMLAIKTLPGNATSCTFTPGEMASIPIGGTYATISASTYQVDSIGGKRCHFEKSYVSAASISVVN